MEREQLIRDWTPEHRSDIGRKKKEVYELYSPIWAQAQILRVILLPIFQDQIRIDNTKGWFHEKPSKHLTVYSPEAVNSNHGQVTLDA